MFSRYLVVLDHVDQNSRCIFTYNWGQVWFSSGSQPVSTSIYVYKVVEKYVWFFPVLHWFSIQLELVDKLIILDLATGKSLFLS